MAHCCAGGAEPSREHCHGARRAGGSIVECRAAHSARCGAYGPSLVSGGGMGEGARIDRASGRNARRSCLLVPEAINQYWQGSN